ncbi:ABC transporter permease [bacterium]|nr:ABC transporter permease [bacterium]
MKRIIAREFLNNLLNLRFSIGLLLSVLLTIVCVLILTHQFQMEMDDHSTRVAIQDDFLNNYAHTNRLGGMIQPQKPPEQFRPFIIGIQRDADLNSYEDNPLPVLFPHIDFLFIVTIIMSLMAILFSYDAITGEREQGTLRMLTAGSISRASILIGKWIGGLASLGIPLMVSLLIGAIYVTVHPLVHWDESAWLSFCLVFLASVMYISLFYLLGLLVSGFSRFSSTSILTSLFLWVLLILVIPNLAPYVVAQIYRIPSVNKIEREARIITGIDRDNLGNELSKKVAQQFEAEYGARFTEYKAMPSDAIRQRVAADPAFKNMHEAYRKADSAAWDEANRIQGEKASVLRQELDRKSQNQMLLAGLVACLSPYTDFLYVATDLTGTGFRSLTYFSDVQSQYYKSYYDYQEKKVAEAKKNDPTFDSNTFLDISDRPRFRFTEEPLIGRLKWTLPFWGVLVLFNIVLFVGAYVKFIRYDVR